MLFQNLIYKDLRKLGAIVVKGEFDNYSSLGLLLISVQCGNVIHISLIIGNVEATHLPSAEYSIFLGFYFKILGSDVGH